MNDAQFTATEDHSLCNSECNFIVVI